MRYDTIVIGSGSAGGIIATRFSEDPERCVLLLDAGPDYPDFDQIPEPIKYGYDTDEGNWNPVHNWQYEARATSRLMYALMVVSLMVTSGTDGREAALTATLEWL